VSEADTKRRWPGRVLVAGLVLLLISAVLWVLPSDEYIFLPHRAQAVAPYVTVPNEKPDRNGGIYFVDVVVRKASLLERVLPWLREGASFIPTDQVEPKGASGEDLRRQSRLEMERSQPIAAAVALRELGYTVRATPIGVLVSLVLRDGPAAGKLQPQDLIVSVNGNRVVTPNDLRQSIRRSGVGSTLTATVRRGTKLVTVRMRPVADPNDKRRAVIGILIEQAADIRLPVKVRIDLGEIGGPSAGLAFALDVMEELGRDVDGGMRVAATGTISLDGAVGPVGGLKQKTLGARRAGVDVFLVPAGDNAREAAHYADGLKIVPVHSFRQALRALATLASTRS
jgi:PDZ domain-containing protein